MSETERIAPQIDRAAETIARELKQMLATETNANAIFGSPVKLDQHTVVPVAILEIGGGAGGGFGRGAAADAGKSFLQKAKRLVARGGGGGAGGGLAIRVRPVGFLCEENGRVVFMPIDVR
jgi:uncharacterized spore protein YtfJ